MRAKMQLMIRKFSKQCHERFFSTTNHRTHQHLSPKCSTKVHTETWPRASVLWSLSGCRLDQPPCAKSPPPCFPDETQLILLVLDHSQGSMCAPSMLVATCCFLAWRRAGTLQSVNIIFLRRLRNISVSVITVQRQENTPRRGGKIAASDGVNLKSNLKHINIHALKYGQNRSSGCSSRNALSSWFFLNSCGVGKVTRPSGTTKLWKKHCNKKFPWGWDQALALSFQTYTHQGQSFC